MSNAWVICPYSAEYPDLMLAIWEEGFKQGYISIGWPKVREVTGQSREAIQAVIAGGCRSAYRHRFTPGSRDIFLGFRIAVQATP